MSVVFRNDMKVDHIQTWGGDEMVARSARVSTQRDLLDTDKIAGLIRYLVRESHNSTLRHSGMTIRFEAPLFVLGQAVRHKFLDVNVQSGRYSEYKPEFYLPENRPVQNKGSSARPEFVGDDTPYPAKAAVASARRTALDAWTTYQTLLQEGVSTEVARNVLPATVYTSWYASGTINAWLDFIWLRNGDHGYPQFEIADLARQVEALVAREFPLVYAAWKEAT